MRSASNSFAVLAAARCRSCHLTVGVGASAYVFDAAGVAVACPHPVRDVKIREVTGLSPAAARSRGLLGTVSECVCFACTSCFKLDVGRDVKRCPKCESFDVRTGDAAIGATCPRCRQRRLVEEVYGVI